MGELFLNQVKCFGKKTEPRKLSLVFRLLDLAAKNCTAVTIVITFVTIVSECSVSSKKILEYTYCHDIPHLERNKKNFCGTGFYQTLEIKYTAKNHGDKIFNDDFIKSMYEIVKLSACSIAILTKL